MAVGDFNGERVGLRAGDGFGQLGSGESTG